MFNDIHEGKVKKILFNFFLHNENNLKKHVLHVCKEFLALQNMLWSPHLPSAVQKMA